MKYDEQQNADMNDSFIFKESPEKDVKMADETPKEAPRAFDKRVLRTVGSRGRTTSPFLAQKANDVGCQASEFLNPQMLEDHQAEIKQLKAHLSSSNPTDSSLVQKYKQDNQILMKKLSEYKKAEKGAMDIVADYEGMKLKYYNVLQENERQKISVQESISKNIDLEKSNRKLNEEK